MPQYGSFTVHGLGPYRTWDADLMRRDKDVVEFFNYGTLEKPGGQLIGTAKLEAGWTITEVGATSAPKK